jgi:CRP-like cAMP-binding protein
MKLIREDSIFGRLLLETQQAATEHLMSRLVELGVLRISGRLYSYLLELAEQAGIMDNRSILSPGPRHLDLAARIAASREEVSREWRGCTSRGLSHQRVKHWC